MYNVKVVSRGFREFKEGQLENILDRRSDNKRMSAPKQINAAAGGGNTLGGIAASIVVSSVGVLESFPPIFIYSIVIQESFGTTGNKGVRVLSGGSDGRIKVIIECQLPVRWRYMLIYITIGVGCRFMWAMWWTSELWPIKGGRKFTHIFPSRKSRSKHGGWRQEQVYNMIC